MTFDHDFCYFILLFYSLFFTGGKKKGEKNNQSRGQKAYLSARSLRLDWPLCLGEFLYYTILYIRIYRIRNMLNVLYKEIKKKKYPKILLSFLLTLNMNISFCIVAGCDVIILKGNAHLRPNMFQGCKV